MWPAIGECRQSRVHHFLTQWVLFDPVLIFDPLFDAYIDGPSTVLGVFQVLSSWIIVSFPSIKGDLTMKTHDVIRIGYSRFKIETGFGELVFLVSNA